MMVVSSIHRVGILPITRHIICMAVILCISIMASGVESRRVSRRQQGGPGPVVQTTYGKVQGTTRLVDSGAGPDVQVDVFRGIPHARPPVGHLRLKKPEPPLSWQGVKDVSVDRTKCIQSNPPGTGESEDCLYLDVYRPRSVNNSSQPLPVMVYIHGGGYNHGAKNSGGYNLATKGVVVVTINYRLGPLGFLSTEDDVIPGNFGMLDQISGMKWVQSNIAAFGGDPNSVTIFGSSAGAASVSLHVISPLSKGLFRRAIMQSGAGSASRDVTPPSTLVTPKQIAMSAGSQLGCGQTLGDGFLLCLQNQTAQEIHNAFNQASHADKSSNSFRPRVENTFGFMPNYPLNLLSTGAFNHVDTLRGFNSQEQGGAIKDDENDGLTIGEFRNYAAKQLNDFPYLNNDVFVQRMVDVYLANVTDPFEIRAKAVEMRSYYTFIGAIVKEAFWESKRNPSKSFLYQFNYRPSFRHTPEWKGILHGWIGAFVFGLHGPSTPTDQLIADAVSTMWTNFAKSGNPTPGSITSPMVHWQPFRNNRPSYLVIDSPMEMKTYDTPENQAFLDLYSDTQKELMVASIAGTPVIG